ncbi:MAG: NADH-quinone oxidoreductase subunit C [Deltaproteobacteria bacterium]|nr:NADH-quinone oxidoreductase subunit C [Deltaproteobacteria bacterium]
MKKDFLMIRNSAAYLTEAVPVIEFETFRNKIAEFCNKADGRIVALLGKKENNESLRIFTVLGSDSEGELYVSSATLNGTEYPSLTPDLPQANLFERELHEEFGIIPKNHPWLKPVRNSAGYEFYSLAGDSVHEVAVGPVHAGVIEPGHFRFNCHGEKVFNLEIRLGYQRRGVEELMLKSKPSLRLVLAESIAGDTVIGHALAYCHAIEALADRQVPQRGRVIRALALELERVANHVGDLGALSNDVGFLPVASYFGRLKAEFSNMLLALNGNRYGRGLLKPGGAAFDLDNELVKNFKIRIERGMKEADEITDLLFSTPSVLARFEKTGVVKTEEARKLGLVGPSARASGLQRDVRCDYPFGMYRFKKIIPVKAATGDVFARARVRALEIKRSLTFIDEALEMVPREKISISCEEIKPSSFSVCMTEGWRGEIAHIAFTNERSEFSRYKIIDPSFHNWSGLEAALKNGAISDFPLCNKSFNLSYAGFDL